MIGLMVSVALWFGATYLVFILAMMAKKADAAGRLSPAAKAIIWPIVIGGWVSDVAFNWTVGLALGVTDDLTLSGKLKHIRRTQTEGWRLKVANFICSRMLNPFDPGHC